MKNCPYCDRKMPSHILEKHIAKRHDPMNAPTKVEGKTPTDPWYRQWNPGEVQECQLCKNKFPAQIMGWHLKLEHGL